MRKRKPREKRIKVFSSPYPDFIEVKKRRPKIKEVKRTEVAEICEVRRESNFGCRNCIYWDKTLRKCSEEWYLKKYNDYLKAKNEKKEN